jgi:hypothetical protein
MKKTFPKLFITLFFAIVMKGALAQQVSVQAQSAETPKANSLAPMPTSNGKLTLDPNSAESKAEIAKQLANPLANMISMPTQWEFSRGMGKNQAGSDQTLLLQPVAPFSLSGGDIFLVRPIIASTRLVNVDGNSGYGVSGVTIESFYAPNTGSSWIWGVGPYASSPSGNSGLYGTQQTGAGVTAVVLNRDGGFTYGLLGFQSWNVGGNPSFGTQNNLFGQPFLVYTNREAWSFGANMQANYNYDARRTTNPLNLTVGKLEVFDGVPVSFSAGPIYYLSNTPGGPSGWGARATLTMVFLK